MMGHIGPRGLTWLALYSSLRCWVPALLGFAVVDGLAAYGALTERNWLEPHVWRAFYGFTTAIGVLESALLPARLTKAGGKRLVVK